ncbi:unnamed protein product, partial [Porites evermanni]
MFLCGAQDARFLTLTSTLPHYAIAAVTSVFFQAIQQLKAERASQGIHINECKDGLHNCGDVSNCENTHGSFNCICKIGTKYKVPSPTMTTVISPSAASSSTLKTASMQPPSPVPSPTMTTVFSPSVATSSTLTTASMQPTSP